MVPACHYRLCKGVSLLYNVYTYYVYVKFSLLLVVYAGYDIENPQICSTKVQGSLYRFTRCGSFNFGGKCILVWSFNQGPTTFQSSRSATWANQETRNWLWGRIDWQLEAHAWLFEWFTWHKIWKLIFTQAYLLLHFFYMIIFFLLMVVYCHWCLFYIFHLGAWQQEWKEHVEKWVLLGRATYIHCTRLQPVQSFHLSINGKAWSRFPPVGLVARWCKKAFCT